MLPGCIVDPVRNLEKDHEVLRPKVERFLGTAEIKAQIGPQIAFGILARMPFVRLTRPLGSHRSRSLGSDRPKQDFIFPRQLCLLGHRRVRRSTTSAGAPFWPARWRCAAAAWRKTVVVLRRPAPKCSQPRSL